jgi:hypothetical protein
MSDVCLNTKRFANSTDFAGASSNDLLRIAAQVLIYAGEVDPSHNGDDESATTTNILRSLREDNEDDLSEPCDSHFRFEYCGQTWFVMDEDFYESYRESTIECLMETIEDEVEQAVINLGALGSYVKIDKDMLVRDMDCMGEIEQHMAVYDGVLHELYFTEYTSGDGSLVTKRGNIYAYRED